MYSIINFIISFGAMQGLIIGVFLLIKGFKLKQDFFYLALVLIGFAALLGRIVAIGLLENQPWFFNNLNFFLLISPALYLYAKGSSRTTQNPLNFNFLHFLPFLIINLVFVLYYFSLENPFDYMADLTNIIKVNDRFSIIYFSIYLYLTYKIVRQNRSSYSKEVYKLLNKLIYNFFGFYLIWLIYVLAELVYFDYTMELIYYYPITIIIAVILYYMSLQFITNDRFLFDIKSITKRRVFILEEAEGENLLNQLTLYMTEEKPYLDGAISLTVLADSLNVNPKALSFVINEYAHKNFNNYINDWRIEEVKKRLHNKEYNQLKMLTIAFDCGFNSKSTFNLAFKRATGLSPSEYRNLTIIQS